MTWPTTPVDTSQLDQNTDYPTIARSAIKQLADNVNAMTPEISTAGATAGQYLQYSSAQSRFQPTSRDLGLAQVALLSFATDPAITLNNTFTGSQTWFRLLPTVIWNNNNIVAVSNNSLTLGPGSYLFLNTEMTTFKNTQSLDIPQVVIATGVTPTQVSHRLQTSSSDTLGMTANNILETVYLVPDLVFTRTVSTTEQISFWKTNNNAFAFPVPLFIWKL